MKETRRVSADARADVKLPSGCITYTITPPSTDQDIYIDIIAEFFDQDMIAEFFDEMLPVTVAVETGVKDAEGTGEVDPEGSEDDPDLIIVDIDPVCTDFADEVIVVDIDPMMGSNDLALEDQNSLDSDLMIAKYELEDVISEMDDHNLSEAEKSQVWQFCVDEIESLFKDQGTLDQVSKIQ